jgi:hypothetical protein
MKWNPSTQKMTVLGMGKRFDSIKDISIDSKTGKLYGITYPEDHFLILDPSTNKLRDLGGLDGSYVSRVMFTDRWGNCYYVDWRKRLVKYDKGKGRLLFARKSLVLKSSKEIGRYTANGTVAFAKDPKNHIIYFTVFGGRLFSLHPKKEGIGKIVDLGWLVPKKFVGSDKSPWDSYTPDLAFGKNGKLYYFVGSEGYFVKKDTELFMEYNPGTEKKHIIFEFPSSKIDLVSGSNTTDKDGNMYFLIADKPSPTHKRTPYLVKFNPKKPVQR